MSGRMVLTTSMMRDFMTCPRLFYNKHILGRVPVKTGEALFFGRVWHEAMEKWWAAPQASRYETAVAVGHKLEDDFEREKFHALLAGYTAMWGKQEWKTVHVEKEFVAPIYDEDGNKHEYFSLAGTIDKIVAGEDRKLYLVEHKTSGDDTAPGSDYWKRLVLDAQVSNYYIGAADGLNLRVAGCLYDVTSKPMLRPSKATPQEKRKYTKEGKLYAGQRENDETSSEYLSRLTDEISKRPDDFFQRKTILRLENEIVRARADLWEIANLIQYALESGVMARNSNACRTRGGALCEYFDPCTGIGSVTDGDRYKDSDYKPSGSKLKVIAGRDPALGF